MIRAYVAGPFRGKNHWEIARNIRAAETIALACWRLGMATYCPHSSTAHFQGTAPDQVWLDGHIAWLDVADVVVLVPRGWEESHGTAAEIARAQSRGIPVFLPLSVSDRPDSLGLARPLGDGGVCLASWLRGRAVRALDALDVGGEE